VTENNAPTQVSERLKTFPIDPTANAKRRRSIASRVHPRKAA
jgi:hypothetical protein